MHSKERIEILPFKQKEIIGKDVYLDNGIKLGEVVAIREEKTNAVNPEDNTKNYFLEVLGDDILNIPIENIVFAKNGLIFQPIWLTSANEKIEKIEEKLAVLNFEGISMKNLLKEIEGGKIGYEKYAENIKEINRIYNELIMHLANLEIEKMLIESESARIGGKMVLEEITKNDFEIKISMQKKKLEICVLNIKHCKELIKKLEKLPYIKKIEKKEIEAMEIKEEIEKYGTEIKSEDGQEELGEEEKETENLDNEKNQKTKMKYRCPKCGNVSLVEDNTRPLIISCLNCGIKGIIKE